MSLAYWQSLNSSERNTVLNSSDFIHLYLFILFKIDFKIQKLKRFMGLEVHQDEVKHGKFSRVKSAVFL